MVVKENSIFVTIQAKYLILVEDLLFIARLEHFHEPNDRFELLTSHFLFLLLLASFWNATLNPSCPGQLSLAGLADVGVGMFVIGCGRTTIL